MEQKIETVVAYCYKCGDITRRSNSINVSEDGNIIDDIIHKHIQENPGHVILVGFRNK